MSLNQFSRLIDWDCKGDMSPSDFTPCFLHTSQSPIHPITSITPNVPINMIPITNRPFQLSKEGYWIIPIADGIKNNTISARSHRAPISTHSTFTQPTYKHPKRINIPTMLPGNWISLHLTIIIPSHKIHVKKEFAK